METYLVGGAVRDRLLGLPVVERDWVVVGTSPEDLRLLGYRQVGSDFPVFLHPETGEEYALARTERKTAPGHTGFICRFDPEVTLEEDLQRRDLTINAIAEASSGELIDPHGGQTDIAAKQLRHVSSAFAEDPLRVLRVARFKARFHHLGFEVAPETHQLLLQMVRNGQLRELTPERVLLELDKALSTPDPAVFFEYLKKLNAHIDLWPEITTEAIAVLAQTRSGNPAFRFFALVLPLSPEAIRNLCGRLKMPNERRDLSLMLTQHLGNWHGYEDLTATEKAELVLATDGLRKAQRFRQFNAACEALTETDLSKHWLKIRELMAGVKASDLKDAEPGPGLGLRIRAEQIRRIETLT
ncbi:MAG: multifunctional CCA tRNA nucleotidyl transferase/2'3'-cyclic phosphodiesterase/2'nucleotidase/phosphatase [Gammaproteobacteria bacterium]